MPLPLQPDSLLGHAEPFRHAGRIQHVRIGQKLLLEDCTARPRCAKRARQRVVRGGGWRGRIIRNDGCRDRAAFAVADRPCVPCREPNAGCMQVTDAFGREGAGGPLQLNGRKRPEGQQGGRFDGPAAAVAG